MSISFKGPKYSVDLNNALGSRILRALGLLAMNQGSLPLEDAENRIQKAVVPPEDRVYLDYLRQLVFDLKLDNQSLLEWS